MPEIGDIIGDQYRIERQLGEGGYGSVYEATRLGGAPGQRVALKVLHEGIVHEEEQVERFYLEARTIQRLSHPNTVRLYDFGQIQEGEVQYIYMALECLKGHSLQEELDKNGPLSADRVSRITAQILRSLMEAHGEGIIHRDIKPSNIFLLSGETTGYDDFVKILDFGIAKDVSPLNSDMGLTRDGTIMGTPNYLAPEQASGQGSVGPWTDIYALGLVMAEALTGELVYKSTGLIACLEQASPDPVPLTQEVLESPLGQIIFRATRKDIEQRYRNTRAMLDELEALGSLHVISALDPLSSSSRRAAANPIPAALPGEAPPLMVPPPTDAPDTSNTRLWLALIPMVMLLLLCAVGSMAALGVTGGGLWLHANEPEVGEEAKGTGKKSKKTKKKSAKKKTAKKKKTAAAGASSGVWTGDDIQKLLEEAGLKFAPSDVNHSKQDGVTTIYTTFRLEAQSGSLKDYDQCSVVHHISNDADAREMFRKPYTQNPLTVIREQGDATVSASCKTKKISAKLLKLLLGP